MSQHPSYTHTVCGFTIVVAKRKAFLCGVPITQGQLLKLQHSLRRALEVLRVPLHPEDCIHSWGEEQVELFGDTTLVVCVDCGVEASAEEADEYRASRDRVLETGTNG